MEIHRDINRLPTFHHAAITTGTFDGVHKGHVTIIDQLREQASKNKGESLLLTFAPHPRLVLPTRHPRKQEPELKLLTTLPEKIELLDRQDIDHLVIIPFTREFSEQSPEEYISKFLVDKFHPQTIITGYDHKFGKDRKGDYKLLEKWSKSYGYEVREIPEYVLQHVTVSSTRIRKALEAGEIKIANKYLGYEYFLDGEIIEGNKIGRTLGYPTANIGINDTHKLIPAYGVYAVKIILKDNKNEQPLKGMMSIGIRPTIGGDTRTIEVNIFDFDRDIYGESIQVKFVAYTRPEVKFDTLEELRRKMQQDEQEIRGFLKDQ